MSHGSDYEDPTPNLQRSLDGQDFYSETPTAQDETALYYTDYADGTLIGPETEPEGAEGEADYHAYTDFVAPRPAATQRTAGPNEQTSNIGPDPAQEPQFFASDPLSSPPASGFDDPSVPTAHSGSEPSVAQESVFASTGPELSATAPADPNPVASLPTHTSGADFAPTAPDPTFISGWDAPQSPVVDQADPSVTPAEAGLDLIAPVQSKTPLEFDVSPEPQGIEEIGQSFQPQQHSASFHHPAPNTSEQGFVADPEGTEFDPLVGRDATEDQLVRHDTDPDVQAEMHQELEQDSAHDPIHVAAPDPAVGYETTAPVFATHRPENGGFFDPLPEGGTPVQTPEPLVDQDWPDAHLAATLGNRPAPGLIRGGLIGIVLFLAIIGGYGLMREASQRAGVSPVSSAQAHTAEDAEAKYQALVAEWTAAKVNIDTSISNWQRQVADNNKLAADIKAQEDLTSSAEAALTASVNALARAKQEAQSARARLQELEDDRLSKQVLDRKVAVADAGDAVSSAQTAVDVAVSEESKVKGAVDQLANAATATAASAQAAEVVVNAAKAARDAVAASNSVLSNTQNSDLQSLENDFYNQAVTQFETAKAQAVATQQAYDVAQKRLGLIADEVAKRRKALEDARAAEQRAVGQLSLAEQALQENEARKGDAANANASYHAALAVAEQNMEDTKTALQAETLELENLNARLQSGLKLAEKLEGDVNLADTVFADTEERMRGAQRDRSEHNAAQLAMLNADLHDNLRTVLGAGKISHPVYDRFVLSSEALFQPGSARLAANGRDTIGRITAVIEQVTAKIPSGADWILRIDGHTDATPLSGNGNYSDNWELSQARALSVVKFLVNNSSLPPTRLSANGFGEHQPLTDSLDPSKQAANRRIEIVLTSR